jgi:hypothetical protein
VREGVHNRGGSCNGGSRVSRTYVNDANKALSDVIRLLPFSHALFFEYVSLLCWYITALSSTFSSSSKKKASEGRAVQLTGTTCPWNTFAVWKVQQLGLIGFPLIGDGLALDRSIGGVEVSMHEKCFPLWPKSEKLELT